jgi:hypothetical protein
MKQQALGYIFIFFVAAAIVSGIYLWQINGTMPFNQQVSHNEISTDSWPSYRNEEYGFEFKSPLMLETSSTTLKGTIAGLNQTYEGVQLTTADLNPYVNVLKGWSDPMVHVFASGILPVERNIKGTVWHLFYNPQEGPGKCAGAAMQTLAPNSEDTIVLRAYDITRCPGPADSAPIVGFLELIASTFRPLDPAAFVNSYAECVQAGFPVMESSPEQCRTSEGLTFVNYDICSQVMTMATNPETGETREFPTPCDVPMGWAKN